MKICLICPVRNADAETERWLANYVAQLEAEDHSVHWPQRDNPQDDPIGVHICHAQCAAIQGADRVDVMWHPTSFGIHFDLGAAYMARKPVRLLGQMDGEPLPRQGSKSYENVMLHWPWGYK